MKFEDFLMQRSEEKQKRLDLEEEVKKLQAELDGEQTLGRFLHCALHGPVQSHPCLLSLFPPQFQELFLELAMVEEEIGQLERKVEELKLRLYQEREQTREWEVQRKQLGQQNHLLCRVGNQSVVNEERCRSQNYEALRNLRKERRLKDRRASVGSAADLPRWNFTYADGETAELSRRQRGRSRNQGHGENDLKPNELSEELLKCLVSIFLELKQASLDKEGSSVVPKLALSCMNSKGLIPKTSFNCTSSTIFFNDNTSSNADPYCILPDLDGAVRDIGPYKNFIQITRSSFDVSRLSECLNAIEKLRNLMHQLCDADLTFLTYKQKLAFWINIYNACIMHAFLEHGLPSTPEKLLALMNKVALNVGGIVLNALAIEHFILRHPSESKHGPAYEKEMLLRNAYGLGYPEPNVTFALCRGSWSSPALRVYTSDDIVNELERAKLEYLEASVGVTSKKKIVVPKLLQWNMLDFADGMESLLEWIYSQLPRSGSLKRLIMECLNGETKSPIIRMVEVQPYDSEFRYLLPL
ncbi:hypothetical protein D8674_041955 [Pyrus ussuriensis x Pyrus communis]|uniref:DUF547 domain-containing protein n=2 Tax=Pyrus ussuriensis x Pyrus communis TaxID=2448454 RepID=A0A5N5GG71_9ROSA|nr:hypothetical protein D8674_041955 [Pyrus ussuriensis x Pyrus communis]